MKKIFFSVGIVFCLFIIYSSLQNITTLLHKKDLVVEASKELDQEKKTNKELKDNIASAQSQKFVEEEARNKLFLVKEGESQIVAPSQASASPKTSQPPQKSNLQKWIELFF